MISMETVDKLGDCIVMEFVDGETLEAFVESGKITKELAYKIISQLLDAIEYMHGKQIVHRDIKPSNIMLTYKGQSVKLIDFGLSDSDTFCVLKLPAGTRKYMAPEQLQPGAQSSPCADIYSLGKVVEYLAEAVHCRRLEYVGKTCACVDVTHRPADIAYVRSLLKTDNKRLWVNVVLLIAALVLSLAIGITMYTRHSARGTSAPTDSTVLNDGNRVVSSDYWEK